MGIPENVLRALNFDQPRTAEALREKLIALGHDRLDEIVATLVALCRFGVTPSVQLEAIRLFFAYTVGMPHGETAPSPASVLPNSKRIQNLDDLTLDELQALRTVKALAAKMRGEGE